MQSWAVSRGEREAAIWTGSEMLLWTIGENEGGECAHQGALYNPETKQWRPVSFKGTRFEETWPVLHLASGSSYCETPHRSPLVWTGHELIVWAHDILDLSRAHGGRYDPETNSWRSLNLEGVSLPRYSAFGAWAGSEMLVWGGAARLGSEAKYLVTGELYDPTRSMWRPMSAVNAPSGAEAASKSVWTGHDLLVRPGESGCPVGARYNLETDTWSAMARSPSEFYRRDTTTVLWAGSAMLIWGGSGHHATFFDGALYYP